MKRIDNLKICLFSRSSSWILILKKWKCILHSVSGKKRLYTMQSTNFVSCGTFGPHLGPCSWHYGAYTKCELRIKPYGFWWYKHFESYGYVMIILSNHRMRTRNIWGKATTRFVVEICLGSGVKKDGKSGLVLYWGLRHCTSALSDSNFSSNIGRVTSDCFRIFLDIDIAQDQDRVHESKLSIF